MGSEKLSIEGATRCRRFEVLRLETSSVAVRPLQKYNGSGRVETGASLVRSRLWLKRARRSSGSRSLSPFSARPARFPVTGADMGDSDILGSTGHRVAVGVTITQLK